MLELTVPKKHKVNLADYNSRQDMALRTLMADFTPFDVEVLQEILFSSLHLSPRKLARALDVTDRNLSPTLKKLQKAGLLSPDGESLLVDKELRKYFEFELQRFDADFKPDLDFLQGLLRKVPIHILPSWYSTPRTSSNIFESIVEKHLVSPQVFQRYLQELPQNHPTAHAVLQAVLAAPDFQISSSDLIAQCNLTRASFEETMLVLEFSFACCVRFVREEDHWEELVTPFHEWHQYLKFVRTSDAPKFAESKAHRNHKSDFAFLEELAEHLKKLSKKTPAEVVERLKRLGLAEEIKGRLAASKLGDEWLEMRPEDQAVLVYRYPANPQLSTAEKAIKRVLHGQWVKFDDFLKGVMIPLSDASIISLQRTGKQWKYATPTYTEEEKTLLHATIFEWLFECGIVAIGTINKQPAFCVTPFGRFFFEE